MMLKSDNILKPGDSAPEAVLRNALQPVPFLNVDAVALVDMPPGAIRRLAVRLDVGGRARDLDCAILDNGQPRYVREAALALKQFSATGPFRAACCLIAPHLGRRAQELCLESGVSYLDYDGNCRLVLDGIYIERTKPARSRTERRALRSIFSPKATRVLHVLLSDPTREWRVKALAHAAQVSIGQVSNVRRWLIDQEWAVLGVSGLRLTDTVSLLQDWRNVHEPLAGTRLGFTTEFDGVALREAVADALRQANAHGTAMLASFSAAQWYEPMSSVSREFLYADKVVFYADAAGLAQLERRLKLRPSAKDEKIVVVHPKNADVFRVKSEPAPGILCSSPVLTFLDLATPQAAREMAQRITVAHKTVAHKSGSALRRNRLAADKTGGREEP